MSDEKLSLQKGIEYMERCLDAELASQRAIAHSAIDMDDWTKAQEILAASKEAISKVEVVRGKFAEFKNAATGILSAEAAAPAPAKENKPAEKAEKSEKPASYVGAVEEMIEKYSFAMAMCHTIPNMNNFFTYDEVSAKADMKKPVQLSNGLWAETAIPEGKEHIVLDALRKHCENS